jgi:hypothetical protein
MLFKFVADYGGCGGPCITLAIIADNVTVTRSQFTATATSGQPYLSMVCNADDTTCSGVRYINNEFYDGHLGNAQISAIYAGGCTASGGCAVNHVLIKGNVIRNMGGEGIEINPRITSSDIVIEGNAIHGAGFGTCSSGWECRPAITLNINQSGAAKGIVVRNNLMWDVASGCIWEKSDATGADAAQILNNVCFDYGKGTGANGAPMGISSVQYGSVAVVKNNVIYAPNGSPAFDPSAAFVKSNNVCAAAGCPIAYGSGVFGSTDPSSVSFLRPGTGSPAVDSGATVDVAEDFAGVARPQHGAFDVGAFELE